MKADATETHGLRTLMLGGHANLLLLALGACLSGCSGSSSTQVTPVIVSQEATLTDVLRRKWTFPYYKHGLRITAAIGNDGDLAGNIVIKAEVLSHSGTWSDQQTVHLAPRQRKTIEFVFEQEVLMDEISDRPDEVKWELTCLVAE
jgi:hypothetical protein